MSEFLVKRNDLKSWRIADGLGSEAKLEADEILVRIERFAFTANNVTYGVAGDQLGYWRFFPPFDGDVEWGMLPVWGFGEVVASRTDGVAVGERLYGYFPPADYLRITAGRISEQRIIDTSSHRAQLPPAYNAYQRVNAEEAYDPANDDARALLWPLFVTSFCLWDSLKENSWFGADQILILSASSKTSIGLGVALADDDASPRSVGVTSAKNLLSLDRLGIYDEVISYDDAMSLDSTIDTTIVDMSGDSIVLGGLHERLGESMKKTLNVGITHWEVPRTRAGYILDRCEFFFAPGHIQKRIKEWGADGFAQRTGAFMNEAVSRLAGWLHLRHPGSLEELGDVYAEVCEGRLAPSEGVVVRLNP